MDDERRPAPNGPGPNAPDGAEPDRRLILAARAVLMLHRDLERVARGADITIPQYRFLLALKRGASRAGDLAAESAVGRPAASSLIAELQRRGLIVRQPDPSDGRGVILRLTPAGIAKHAQFERELARVLGQVMPPADSEGILEAITQLAYRIDGRRGGPADG